ncbi:MAG: DNA-binding response regulator, partial [Candidatus Methanomethylicota archaeon]
MKNIGKARKRALIVEDETAISALCRQILINEGFEVDL